MPGVVSKKWIRGLSNKELKEIDPQDRDFQRELRRRHRREKGRKPKPVAKKAQPSRRALLDDSAPTALPSGRKSML